MSPRYVSFVILFLYTLLMNITDRLRKTNEKDNRVSMMLLDPRVSFLCTFIYSTYFLSSTAALYTTTSATTANYDDHDKGLETRRISSPLVFFTSQPSLLPPHRRVRMPISATTYDEWGHCEGSFFPFIRLFICAYIWIFFPHIFRSG